MHILQTSIMFHLIDNKLIFNVIHMVQIIIQMNNHINMIWVFIIDLNKYDIILNMF